MKEPFNPPVFKPLKGLTLAFEGLMGPLGSGEYWRELWGVARLALGHGWPWLRLYAHVQEVPVAGPLIRAASRLLEDRIRGFWGSGTRGI